MTGLTGLGGETFGWWARPGEKVLMAGGDELFQMDLNLHPNEALGLLTIGDEALLGEHGWDLGFWAVLDEGEIEDCIVAIGHRRDSPENEGWEIERLRAKATGNAFYATDEDEGVHPRLTRLLAG